MKIVIHDFRTTILLNLFNNNPKFTIFIFGSICLIYLGRVLP
ncbi:hypothetical protein FDUTEX481_10076 [Tolypothrix sp. PCC 7601]|nr:hypothetical protein FDUTEX481_10076 [Tolypothrix sp. PCC 7601]